jgi:hypothetical protein
VGVRGEDGAHVSAVGALDEDLAQVYRLNGIDPVELQELDHSDESAALFARSIEASKAGNKFGAAVYVYHPVEKYKDMRLFLSADHLSGVAVKDGGDIVSVFNLKGGSGRVHPLLETAIAAGGRDF